MNNLVGKGYAHLRDFALEFWRRMRVMLYRFQCRLGSKSLTLLSDSEIKSGLTVYCAIRNELHQLPQFLKHYRRLGVARFTIVDNGSTDGSTEFLRTQKDVTLYFTAASFRRANFGFAWHDALIEQEGLNRWICVVDVDEYLVFSEKFGSTIPDLIRY
jgi:hypothetical protein